LLPAEENISSNNTRSKLTLVAPGEDETATPSTQQECLDEIEEEEEKKKKKSNPMVKSQ